MVYALDPFFHFHKPLEGFYYTLDNQRSQNDGIMKHFDYNAVITGTSMTENFKTSEVDELFDCNAVKVSFSGAMFKEINDTVRTGFDSGHNIRYVIRCIDDSYLINDKDADRLDLGEYPDYLYDRNPFNDVKYLLNRDVIFSYCGKMLLHKFQGVEGGITSFDDYGITEDAIYGYEQMTANIEMASNVEQIHLSEEDRETEIASLQQNVTALAKEHPETTFYYFFPPYSIALWGALYAEGTALQQIEEEQVAIEEMLQYDNIRLFSFNTDLLITTDSDNYRDSRHYGPWINSEILQRMSRGENQITAENYEDYLQELKDVYLNYDYVNELP